MNTDTSIYKSIARTALATTLLLSVPLAAMQVTDEVAWGLFDFVIAGALLFGTGLGYNFVTRKGSTMVYRAAVGAALGTGLLLIWANLAVGIIGPADNPANLIYFGVIAVGITGAVLARFRPRGMERALYATALAQVVITAIALLTGLHRSPGSSLTEMLAVNGFFTVLFVASALLFRYDARHKEPLGRDTDADV